MLDSCNIDCMKNPILRNIGLWFVETTIASLLEAFLATIVYIWNRCIAANDLPFRQIQVESLYVTAHCTNDSESTASNELSEFVGDTIWGNLIDLDENIEDSENVNIKYPIRETCEDILTFDSAVEFGDFQLQQALTPYTLLKSERTEDERDYPQIDISKNECPQNGVNLLQGTFLQEDTFNDIHNFEVHFDDQTRSHYSLPVRRNQGIYYNINTDYDNEINEAISAETRDVDFLFNCDNAHGHDFIYEKRKPLRSIYFQPRKESAMVVNKEVLVKRDVRQDCRSPLSEYERGNAIHRNKYHYENSPALFSDLEMRPLNKVNELLEANRPTSDVEFFEFCENDFQEVIPLAKLLPRNFDRVEFSVAEKDTYSKTRNLKDEFVPIGSSVTSKERQKSPNNGNKKVHFNTEIETFTYEPSLSVKENFNLQEEVLVENESVDANYKENYAALENSDFVCPRPTFYLDGLYDGTDFMEKWLKGEEAFHQMITSDPCEYRTRYFEKFEFEDIIDFPEEKLKSPSGPKEGKALRKKKSLKGFIPYRKSSDYCKDLKLPFQRLKLHPKSLMDKFKKQLFKK